VTVSNVLLEVACGGATQDATHPRSKPDKAVLNQCEQPPVGNLHHLNTILAYMHTGEGGVERRGITSHLLSVGSLQMLKVLAGKPNLSKHLR
jgi:hypothetical protein